MPSRDVLFRVKDDSAEARSHVDILSARLDELSDRIATPKIDLDDLDASVKLKEISFALDKVGDKIAKPSISLDGARHAEVQLDKLELKLDRLGSKSVNVDVNKHGMFSDVTSGLKSLISKSALKSLMSGGESAGEDAGSGLADFAGSPVGLGAIGLGTSMLPAIAGGIAGLGIGGGGLAAAFATDRQDVASLKHTFSSAFDSIGKSFAPVLHQIAGFAKQISPLLVSMFKAARPGIEAFIKALEPAIKQVLPELTQMLKQNAPAMHILGEAFGDLLKIAVKLFTGLSTGFRASAVVVKAVVDGIGGLVDFLASIIGKTVTLIYDVLTGRWGAAWRMAKSIVTSFLNFIQNTMGKFETWFAGVAVHAMEGFLHGLESMGGKILGWVEHFAGSIIDKFKSVLSIFSPSKKMHEIGVYVAAGLIEGMDSMGSAVNAASERMAHKVTGGVTASAHRMTTGSGGGQMQLVVSAEGDDLTKAVVKAMRYEIKNNGGGNVQRHLGWGAV